MKQSVLSDKDRSLSFLEAPTESDVTVEAASGDRKMLVYRLSEAARRIREEAELIRRSTFSDSRSRLMRILGETIEEQQQAIKVRDGSGK